MFIWHLQKLCDYVCDLLLEESNVQPVSTPVTVCGDIHGQVREHLESPYHFFFWCGFIYVVQDLLLCLVQMKYNFHTKLWCVCVVVLRSLWTLPNWRPGSWHELHLHGLFISASLNLSRICLSVTVFWHSVSSKPLSSVGRLRRPRILQLGDVHLSASAESQMAWPHHSSAWKPREQADHPSLWFLWWGKVDRRWWSATANSFISIELFFVILSYRWVPDQVWEC